MASCFSFVLDVARYAFEQTTNHLLNNQIKSVQNLMTDLGLSLRTTVVFFLLSHLAQEKVWDCAHVALYLVVKPKERGQIARDVDLHPCGLKLSQKRG